MVDQSTFCSMETQATAERELFKFYNICVIHIVYVNLLKIYKWSK